MFGSRLAMRYSAVALMMAALAGTASAQEEAAECPPGSTAIGSIGYTELECNCTLRFDPANPDRQSYDFRSEPRIGGIKDGGPADGKLKDGDIITAIDGHLITTREGGRRFANLEPGVPVSLAVRRDGRQMEVTLTPGADCTHFLPPPKYRDVPPTPPAPFPRRLVADTLVYADSAAYAVPPPPRYVELVAVPQPPSPALLTKGWFGFSIKCSYCSVQAGEEGEFSAWQFSSYPTVERVEQGSPAHQAGIRAGDILTHIDDHALTSDEGGRLFGAVQPGDTVTFRYLRNNREQRVRLVAKARLVLRVAPPVAVKPHTEITRFSGVIGNVQIQVTGGAITVNRTESEVIIKSQDITVRIKRTGGS